MADKEQRKIQAARRAIEDRLCAVTEESPRSGPLLWEALSVFSGELPPLDYDEGGLDLVEETYRNHVSSLKTVEIEALWPLVALFLGETIIRNKGGSWIVYQGREYASPIVLCLDQAKHVDVFQFCQGLHQNHRAIGARQNKALRRFFQGCESNAFD